MRFGVVLGTKGISVSKIKCTIFKVDLPKNIECSSGAIQTEEIALDKKITGRMNHFCMLPLFDSKESHDHLMQWITQHEPRREEPKWHEGIHQTNSSRWVEGKKTRVFSSKSLVKKSEPYWYEFDSSKGFEERLVPESSFSSQHINKTRLFVADVNRNAPHRHECLCAGLIQPGLAVFNNILWCLPDHPKEIFNEMNTSVFEAALYSICKSNHINGLALNWLGF